MSFELLQEKTNIFYCITCTTIPLLGGTAAHSGQTQSSGFVVEGDAKQSTWYLGEKKTQSKPYELVFLTAAVPQLFAPCWCGRKKEHGGGRGGVQQQCYTLNRTACTLAAGAHDHCAHTLHRWVSRSPPRHRLPPCTPHSLWSEAEQKTPTSATWQGLSFLGVAGWIRSGRGVTCFWMSPPGHRLWQMTAKLIRSTGQVLAVWKKKNKEQDQETNICVHYYYKLINRLCDLICTFNF